MVIGFIMQGYSRVIGLVPRRWMVPVTQLGHGGAAARVLGAVQRTG